MYPKEKPKANKIKTNCSDKIKPIKKRVKRGSYTKVAERLKIKNKKLYYLKASKRFKGYLSSFHNNLIPLDSGGIQAHLEGFLKLIKHPKLRVFIHNIDNVSTANVRDLKRLNLLYVLFSNSGLLSEDGFSLSQERLSIASNIHQTSVSNYLKQLVKFNILTVRSHRFAKSIFAKRYSIDTSVFHDTNFLEMFNYCSGYRKFLTKNPKKEINKIKRDEIIKKINWHYPVFKDWYRLAQQFLNCPRTFLITANHHLIKKEYWHLPRSRNLMQSNLAGAVIAYNHVSKANGKSPMITKKLLSSLNLDPNAVWDQNMPKENKKEIFELMIPAFEIGAPLLNSKEDYLEFMLEYCALAYWFKHTREQLKKSVTEKIPKTKIVKAVCLDGPSKKIKSAKRIQNKGDWGLGHNIIFRGIGTKRQTVVALRIRTEFLLRRTEVNRILTKVNPKLKAKDRYGEPYLNKSVINHISDYEPFYSMAKNPAKRKILNTIANRGLESDIKIEQLYFPF